MSDADLTPQREGTPEVCHRLRIAGRVQGVGFRVSLAREATGAALVGQVRNLDDGSVEAVLQGPLPDVERVEAWCRHGPPAARVRAVDIQEMPRTDAARFVVLP